MSRSPFHLMQKAVDIVGTSTHPTNKIATTLAGQTKDGRSFVVSHTNFWPEPIIDKIGTGQRIGSSSGTIHAETACIMAAPATEGADVFITDLPCPNCVKNMAEARIRAMYIDHKGFDKDYAQRRGLHFKYMAMRICEKAGISVYEIHRKDEKIIPILEIGKGYAPAVEKPLRMADYPEAPSTQGFIRTINDTAYDFGAEPFALGLARGSMGHYYMLAGQAHPTIGFTSHTMEEPEGKYSFILEPINRLIMAAARFGLKIDPQYLYSSRVPTSREQINMVGAELDLLYVGDMSTCRDDDGLRAMQQLKDAEIITFKTID